MLGFPITASAQSKKSLTISRTEKAPKIDGVLNDSIWGVAEIATGFTQFQPNAGVADSIPIRTVVKMAYDNKAIYLSAYLYDDPNDMMSQVTARDDFGQTDFFALILNPNNDAQNDTQFFVFSSGVQADATSNPSNGEDFGWNAVWESAVKKHDDGWSLEMEIPYRTLRFENREIQTWGIQFHRFFRRYRSQYTWNPIDVTKGNFGLYHGELLGLKNIKPPTRLAFYPFTTGILSTFDGETDNEFRLGLDVKYGITENFTLDMTLIPDFSQAGFDNLELNLGPFELAFAEQRQFFTEGVDLFNKGGMFFSRRVGSRPTGTVVLEENEIVENYPNTVDVINAAKVSGRTKKGLGVGIFNAITEKTLATVRDTITNAVRDTVVEPLANYNILTLEQQFNQNSSVSVVNTNVTRDGGFRDANVTAIVADITNKRNTYNLFGRARMSNLNLADGTSTGFSTRFVARKIHGNYRYSFDYSYADTKFDMNDLGLLFRNNFNNFGVDFGYQTFKPTKRLNNYNWNTYINYNRLADPSTFTGFGFGGNYNAQTKETLHNYGGRFDIEAGKQYDYFEPRADGRFFIYENFARARIYLSTNYNYTFAIDANIQGAGVFEKERNTRSYRFQLRPRVRFNDNFLMVYSFEYEEIFNDRGYANNSNQSDSEIVFGQRDQLIMENNLRSTYSFNPFHTLSLNFRNYWSTVTYDQNPYFLQQNGRLTEASESFEELGLKSSDINFSTWNIDLNYTWQFAPGSFLTALYRNQLFNNDRESMRNYANSLNTLFEQPALHFFSLRLQYFIDYNQIKDIFKSSNKSNS
ncbi:MAG: DUF5916 domain-containing protein [Bacteroidota bacterium]